MKYLVCICLSFSIFSFSQEKVEAILINSIDLNEQSIVGIDNFGILYTIKNETFSKKENGKTITYSNVQLGNISSANVFNPLKINLFYKNFNTAIILDNRLAEIKKIDFNAIQPYKNVSHVSTGYDTTLWIFNTDTQQLELFDYKTNKIRATTMPTVSNVLAMTSNYNFCWLLTERFLYKFNYFGSMDFKIENKGYKAIAEDNGNLIIKGDNELFYLSKQSEQPIPIKIEELLINQFLVTNETLYIYHDEILRQYQLKQE